MDKNTPLENRLYFRCRDCLAMTCVEMNVKEYKRKHYSNPITCGICGGNLEFLGEVEGTRWSHTVEVCDCNENCQSAQGPKCTCRCGGQNHGIGYKYHIVEDAAGIVEVTPEGDNAKRLALAEEYRTALSSVHSKMIAALGDNWTKYLNHVWLDRNIWDTCRTAQYHYEECRKGKQHKSRMDKIAKFSNWIDKWAKNQ